MAGLHGYLGSDETPADRYRLVRERCGSHSTGAPAGAFVGVDRTSVQSVFGTLESSNACFAADGQDLGTDDCLKSLRAASTGLPESGPLASLRPSHLRGNLAVHDGTTGTMTLMVDCSGIFPLYYAVDRGSLAFSSRQGILGHAMESELDYVGILEFMRYGYTIGARSFYRDVRRALPGQIVSFNKHSQELTVVETSDLWTVSDEADGGETGHAEIWRSLVDNVSTSNGNERSAALMLSGGWDSRTLLAAYLATMGAPGLTAYVHGDRACREVRLADDIAALTNVDLVHTSLESMSLSPDSLRRYHDATENVVFPHWHLAGDVLRDRDVSVAAAGILGEVLGGHYGASAAYHGMVRVIAVATEMVFPKAVGPKSVQPTKDLMSSFLEGEIDRPWFIAKQAWSCFPDVTDEINDDIAKAIARYTARGVPADHRLVEAFVTEHRGAQYIAQQLLSIRHSVAVSAPFALYEPLKIAASLPSSMKVHNTLNRGLLRRYHPELLEFPMAATLLKASYPIVAQEGSRAVRKVLEKSRRLARKAPAGKVRAPHTGWANFEFLRTRTDFAELPRLLTNDLWDADNIRAVLDDRVFRNDRPASSAHPYFDMLMKMVTIDLTASA